MDDLLKEISFHNKVKDQVLQICRKLGFEAKEEHGGKGWRADVYVLANGQKYAFEIQISAQSLKKTLERQEKYIRDGVIGCWLFENEPRQLAEMAGISQEYLKEIERGLTLPDMAALISLLDCLHACVDSVFMDTHELEMLNLTQAIDSLPPEKQAVLKKALEEVTK